MRQEKNRGPPRFFAFADRNAACQRAWRNAAPKKSARSEPRANLATQPLAEGARKKPEAAEAAPTETTERDGMATAEEQEDWALMRRVAERCARSPKWLGQIAARGPKDPQERWDGSTAGEGAELPAMAARWLRQISDEAQESGSEDEERLKMARSLSAALGRLRWGPWAGRLARTKAGAEIWRDFWADWLAEPHRMAKSTADRFESERLLAAGGQGAIGGLAEKPFWSRRRPLAELDEGTRKAADLVVMLADPVITLKSEALAKSVALAAGWRPWRPWHAALARWRDAKSATQSFRGERSAVRFAVEQKPRAFHFIFHLGRGTESFETWLVGASLTWKNQEEKDLACEALGKRIAGGLQLSEGAPTQDAEKALRLAEKAWRRHGGRCWKKVTKEEDFWSGFATALPDEHESCASWLIEKAKKAGMSASVVVLTKARGVGLLDREGWLAQWMSPGWSQKWKSAKEQSEHKERGDRIFAQMIAWLEEDFRGRETDLGAALLDTWIESCLRACSPKGATPSLAAERERRSLLLLEAAASRGALSRLPPEKALKLWSAGAVAWQTSALRRLAELGVRPRIAQHRALAWSETDVLSEDPQNESRHRCRAFLAELESEAEREAIVAAMAGASAQEGPPRPSPRSTKAAARI
jgi:hypothetical protein